jgi:hypothetical protein
MELNKENRIESRFKEQIAILIKLIEFEDWIKYCLDLYFSFELMANYHTDKTQLKNLIKNELYTISKKLSKLLAKEDITIYVGERHRYSNITKLIKENEDFGFDFFYKETIAEFYIILDLTEVDIEYLDLFAETSNKVTENNQYYFNAIKKTHPTIIKLLKILAYLDYLNFLKKIEKKPEIVEKELEHKKVTSSVKFNSKAENLSYKWIGKTTDLDRIHKNLKPFLHSDTNSINDFRAIFKGAKLEHTKPIKLNFVASELIYFIKTLMNEEYIKKESSWNWNRINVLFKNFNGSEFPKSMKTTKSQLDPNLTPASKEKIDNIFK